MLRVRLPRLTPECLCGDQLTAILAGFWPFSRRKLEDIPGCAPGSTRNLLAHSALALAAGQHPKTGRWDRGHLARTGRTFRVPRRRQKDQHPMLLHLHRLRRAAAPILHLQVRFSTFWLFLFRHRRRRCGRRRLFLVFFYLFSRLFGIQVRARSFGGWLLASWSTNVGPSVQCKK